jgi:hypothetical protein
MPQHPLQSQNIPAIHHEQYWGQTPFFHKLLTADSTVPRDSDLHAFASQYLQELSTALIDDVVKVMDAPSDKPLM